MTLEDIANHLCKYVYGLRISDAPEKIRSQCFHFAHAVMDMNLEAEKT